MGEVEKQSCAALTNEGQEWLTLQRSDGAAAACDFGPRARQGSAYRTSLAKKFEIGVATSPSRALLALPACLPACLLACLLCRVQPPTTPAALPHDDDCLHMHMPEPL